MENLNDVERLAIAQAICKVAGKQVTTDSCDNLRAAVDREYKELYEQTGSKSFDVKVNGQDVGTYSIAFSKPRDSVTTLSFEVYDYFALADWFEDIPDEMLRDYVATSLSDFAEWYFQHTGEMPTGCDIEKIITPATDKQYCGGRFKIDPDSVFAAMGDLLPARIVGLLEG